MSTKYQLLNNRELVVKMQQMHDKYITMSQADRIKKHEQYQRVMAEINTEYRMRGMHHVRLTDPVLIQEKIDKNQQVTEDLWNEPSIVGQEVDIPQDNIDLDAVARLTRLFSL